MGTSSGLSKFTMMPRSVQRLTKRRLVRQVLAVSGEEEPLVDILERHEVKVLACVRL